MRIHAFQHVPFEDIGSLHNDVAQHHSLSTTHWYRGDSAPAMDSFDLLIIMGGPMGVYDDAQFSWLSDEKHFIGEAIAAGKKIIGICLGAQLISCVLGAKVKKNHYKEIGWFPLIIHADNSAHPIAKILSSQNKVFHWHGDTFDLPINAQLLASSAACTNQAYVIGDKIFAFQFHLETTVASAKALIEACHQDLDASTYVQSADTILCDENNFKTINQCMSNVWKFITQP